MKMNSLKKKEITQEQKEECRKLNAIYESKKSPLELTQKTVSEQLGISQGAVNHYLKGTNALNASIASKFAKLLQVTVDQFSTRLFEEIKQMADTLDQEKLNESTLLESRPRNSVTIKLLDVYAAAAPSGIINIDYPEVIKEITIDQDQVLELLGRKTVNNINLINVPTDSMSPTINKGDVAFIDITCHGYCGEGVYAFVDEYGELFIKRLQRVPNGGMKILSDNPKYSPLDFTQEELERCYIVGKLVKALPLHMIDL